MELSNLPRDLVEEIISKLSVTSQGAMRLTCKKLNTNFEEKHISEEEESMVMMVMDHKVYLMDINLHGTRNIADLSIKRKAKLISLKGLDDQVVDISEIFHCDGLLLCVTKERNKKKLVVWNPFSAETRWIEPRDYDHGWDHYAIGYEKKKKKNKSCSIHKILRCYDNGGPIIKCEIYDLKTSSWRGFNITPREWPLRRQCSVSIKGNTYWIATDRNIIWGQDFFYFLICFDFTKERFGPRLSLPFKCHLGDNLALSSVREEQLVVLFPNRRTCAMEIWVTTNIKLKTVSWNKLFIYPRFQTNVDFFFDEEKKIAVVIDKSKDYTRHIAYIIGEDGYMRQVDLGEVTDEDCLSFCIHIKKPKSKHTIF